MSEVGPSSRPSAELLDDWLGAMWAEARAAGLDAEQAGRVCLVVALRLHRSDESVTHSDDGQDHWRSLAAVELERMGLLHRWRSGGSAS